MVIRQVMDWHYLNYKYYVLVRVLIVRYENENFAKVYLFHL